MADKLDSSSLNNANKQMESCRKCLGGASMRVFLALIGGLV